MKKKSINDEFVIPFSNFTNSVNPVKRLLDVYPTFLELYDDDMIKKFKDELGIEKNEQIDDVLEKTLDGVEIINPPKTILAKLHWIASERRRKEFFETAKRTGVYRQENVPITELDKLQFQSVQDSFDLFTEPEFLNEMVLVYAVTIFKEYLKSVLEKVFEICPELRTNLETNETTNSIPDEITEVLKLFKNNMEYDLETQIPEWELFYEMNLRRNRLIHHKGIPNKIHNQLTGNVGFLRIKTDTKYAYDSLETIKKIQSIIQDHLSKQYVNPKFIEQMSSEDTLD